MVSSVACVEHDYYYLEYIGKCDLYDKQVILKKYQVIRMILYKNDEF
ncbi:hypothetical protein JPSP25_13650 [Staphylococcus pseudintermedius]